MALGTGLGVDPVAEALAAHGDGDDFEPPEVTELRREGTTTIEMRLSDNHDVDESTINASDFSVSPGTISGLNVSENGTDADLEVTLEEGVDNQAVTISGTNDTDIADTNGNEFDPTDQFSAVVPAPGNPPQLHDASRVNASAVEVVITDDEGVDNDSIDTADFTLNRSTIENTSATEEGSNASVVLTLAPETDTRPLLVGLSGEADIEDVDGTVVDSTFRTIRVGGVEAPELQSVSKASDTEIELYFLDDVDVAESSFQAHDFLVAGSSTDTPVSAYVRRNGVSESLLQEYRLANVTATEDGRNASVVLALPRPVDEDELLVRVRDGAVLTDTSGHEFDPTDEDTTRQAVLTGMDGAAPEIEEFAVTGGSDGSATITVVPSERLGGLNVSVGGAVSDTIDLSAFTPDESRLAYETTYTAAAEGNLTFRLANATDGAGNTRERFPNGEVGTDLDRSGPDPVVAIDFVASENLTLVFDARHTSDLTGVSSYTWAFDDGTNATGERVTKTFEPGTRTVSLTAVDTEGRSGTASVALDLSPGAGDASTASAAALNGVRRVASPDLRVVTPGGGPAETALVEVRKPSPGVPVSVAEGRREALAASSDVTLVDVEVVPARYGQFTLGLSANDAGSVADAAAATDTRPVGGFAIAHEVPDAGFRSVTLRVGVGADRLDSLGATPEEVTILRQQGEEWQRLETRVLGRDDGTVQFRADAPGLSRFAVVVPAAGSESAGGATSTPTPTSDAGATPTPTPTPEDGSVVVSNATLNASAVEPGDVVLVNATVENRADGNTVYVAGLSVNGSVVATESVTLPAGEQRSVAFRYVPDETGTYPVAVNGTTARELTVGGGGLLASVLGVFDPIVGLLGSVLGFLPTGLLRPLVTFVFAPLLVGLLLLKGVALYLGY